MELSDAELAILIEAMGRYCDIMERDEELIGDDGLHHLARLLLSSMRALRSLSSGAATAD